MTKPPVIGRSREEMAKRLAQDIPDGSYVTLGIGIPEMVAKFVPADRYLVETDAPYLAPIPHRGTTNEPSYVAHTAAKVAEVRGIPLEQLGAETTANFFRLFSKAKLV